MNQNNLEGKDPMPLLEELKLGVELAATRLTRGELREGFDSGGEHDLDLGGEARVVDVRLRDLEFGKGKGRE